MCGYGIGTYHNILYTYEAKFQPQFGPEHILLDRDIYLINQIIPIPIGVGHI